ncbi:MAG: hypothetical protein FWD82_04425 [Defluviitaleaceae bacterium]|nr:hypothetical protein [Defluviitaleaceae bacterium]
MDNNIYSEIKIVALEKVKVARYVIISPSPENDVVAYMNNWAKNSGLLDVKGYMPRKFGWDFPFVSEEQRAKFNLRGYVYLYTLPENFTPKCDGAEITYLEADEYAVMRITEPFNNPFETIPNGYKKLFEFVQSSEYKTTTWESRYCLEEVIEINGITYMDIYIPVK